MKSESGIAVIIFWGSYFTLSKHGVGRRFEIASRRIRDCGLLDSWSGSVVRAFASSIRRMVSSLLFWFCLPIGM